MLAFLVFMALAAPTFGQEPAEQSPSSSVEQYRESVPTATGQQPTSRRERPRRSQLPPDVRERVARQGGSDAEALGAIASEPGLGAPPEPRARRRGSPPAAPTREPSAAAAAAEATLDGGSGGMTLLLVGVVAITAAIGGAALQRRRAG